MKRCKPAGSTKKGAGQFANSKLTSFFLVESKSIPKAARSQVLESSVAYVVKDMKPFSSIEETGFIQLANTLIEMGAKHRKMDASQLLPSRFTLKRHVDQKSKVFKSQQIDLVKSALQQYGSIGITTDLWTDLLLRHFLSITFHFVNTTNLDLKSFVLCVEQFTEEEKTGANIRRFIENVLTRFGLTNEMILKNCYFVTDNGANMKVALVPYQRIPCACHMLATVVRHILQLQLESSVLVSYKGTEDEEFVRNIQSTISSVKGCVKYFKKSGLNCKLKKSLKQSNDTRWNSILEMLCSVLNAREEIHNLLEEKDQLSRIETLDWSVVSILVERLKPFESATKQLEGERFPTIQKVFLCYTMLKRELQISPTDLTFVKFIKKRGFSCLTTKFTISDLQLLGLFVHPKFKSLVPLAPAKRDDVHNLARSLVYNISSFIASDQEPGCSTSDHVYVQPASKQRKINLDDEFLHWQDTNAKDSEHDEVKSYCRFPFLFFFSF